jgi:hypothetical protein
MTKESVAAIKKMRMLLVKLYEQRLMQRLKESDVSTSVNTIRPTRYNGLFARTLTILLIEFFL